MRLGRPTPLPRLRWPARGIACIVAGLVVLAAVQGAGAVIVGLAMVTYGLCALDRRIHGQVSHQRTNAAPAVHSGLAERIVVERRAERRTRERYWP